MEDCTIATIDEHTLLYTYQYKYFKKKIYKALHPVQKAIIDHQLQRLKEVANNNKEKPEGLSITIDVRSRVILDVSLISKYFYQRTSINDTVKKGK